MGPIETETGTLVRTEHRGRVQWLLGDHPPVNALSQPVRQGLLDGVRRAEPESDAVVIAAEGRTFFAGADLEELERGLASPGLLELIEACDGTPLPVVAALHGTVYGGGIVVACAADRRMASEGTRFAMPEVSLGLLPTFGGTVFLTRWLGVEAALSLIIDGTVWSTADALRAGLVDAVVPAPALQARAQSMAEQRPAKQRMRDAAFHRAEDPRAVADAFARRRAHQAAHAPDFQACSVCLDVMEQGLALPLEDALAAEHRAFLQLLDSPQSRRLRRLFFADRRLRRGGAAQAPIAARIASCGADARALQSLALELLASGAVPDAEWLDALIVDTLGLARYRPSLIEPLLGSLR